MHERTLRDFFVGNVPATDLAHDLVGAMERRRDVTRYSIVDMDEEFAVRPDHLVRVCDAVIAGIITPESLQAIGFCLQASDAFLWDADEPDGERVSEVTAEWSAPLINHELNAQNVAKWRHYLLTGEYTLGW